VSTTPDPQSDYEFSFDAQSQGQPPPPRKKHQEEDDTTIMDEVVDGIADSVFDRFSPGGCGCVFGPLWWLIRLPFRVIGWVLNLFD
jgi:hypothetical protein